MELWQTVSKMLKILLTFWLRTNASLDKAWGKNYMNCSSCFCWLTKGRTWRMSNVCWWEWWNSRKYARGRAACEYNELEWSRFAGLPAFMSIKNWRRIYTDNQEQSSLFLAMKNGRKSLERQKADQRRQATMDGFQPFFALFLFLCLSLAIAQLIKSLPSGRTSSWCLPFAFMHIKLAENLMLCWRKVTSVHQRLR